MFSQIVDHIRNMNFGSDWWRIPQLYVPYQPAPLIECPSERSLTGDDRLTKRQANSQMIEIIKRNVKAQKLDCGTNESVGVGANNQYFWKQRSPPVTCSPEVHRREVNTSMSS